MKQGLAIYFAALASPELSALLAAMTFVPPSDPARIVVPLVVVILAALLLVRAWLRRSKRRLERNFEGFRQNLQAIVWEADPATLRFTWVSSGAERLLGYPAQQWLDSGDFWATLLEPGDRARLVERLRHLTREGDRTTLDYDARTADGRRVHLRNRIEVVADNARDDQQGGQPGVRECRVRLVGLMTLPVTPETTAAPAGEAAAGKQSADRRRAPGYSHA